MHPGSQAVPMIWKKSTLSGGACDCVEVAVVPDAILARDSKDPEGPVLRFSINSWREFTRSVQGGMFTSSYTS